MLSTNSFLYFLAEYEEMTAVATPLQPVMRLYAYSNHWRKGSAALALIDGVGIERIYHFRPHTPHCHDWLDTQIVGLKTLAHICTLGAVRLRGQVSEEAHDVAMAKYRYFADYPLTQKQFDAALAVVHRRSHDWGYHFFGNNCISFIKGAARKARVRLPMMPFNRPMELVKSMRTQALSGDVRRTARAAHAAPTSSYNIV